MRPRHITYTIAAADADGVCTSQTKASSGALTLNGALVTSGVAGFAIPRHVSITSGGSSETGKNFTVVGTNRYDKALTETIVGPGTGLTVYGTKNFKTITSVTVDAALTGNVTVGSGNSLETGWFPVDTYCDAGYQVSTGGSMTVAIQTTMGDIWNVAENSVKVDEAVGTQLGLMAATAVRLSITGHTSGNVTFDIISKRHK